MFLHKTAVPKFDGSHGHLKVGGKKLQIHLHFMRVSVSSVYWTYQLSVTERGLFKTVFLIYTNGNSRKMNSYFLYYYWCAVPSEKFETFKTRHFIIYWESYNFICLLCHVCSISDIVWLDSCSACLYSLNILTAGLFNENRCKIFLFLESQHETFSLHVTLHLL